MIGRKNEQIILNRILKKKSSSFLAVTGRRRIGKTYIIDQFFKEQMCFRLTGIQNASLEEQLTNFTTKLTEYSSTPVISSPRNWQEAFLHLKRYLSTLSKHRKQVIFIDELPWIATSKSGVLQHLAHLWNDYLSKEKHFILIVCGSASSWLTKNIINDKAGLHNRVTDLISLKPFTLAETKQFLNSHGIKLTNHELTKLYMTFGGVPFYLEQIQKGESASIATERICFSNEGILKNEYNNLYRALFKNAENHEAIVRALAKKTTGLSRNEIIKQSGVQGGGPYNRTMNDLLLSGFITEFIPFEKKKRGVLYRLNDEFSVFYHRFMKPNQKYTKGMWLQIEASQAYKVWTGYAFENLCFKHINELKEAMGLTVIYTETSNLRVQGNPSGDGFQIDLIIDRKDNVIHLCELKYHEASFKIDKTYAQKLRERKQRFIEFTGTKKQVFNTFITNHGVLENQYAVELVDSEVILDNLF